MGVDSNSVVLNLLLSVGNSYVVDDNRFEGVDGD